MIKSLFGRLLLIIFTALIAVSTVFAQPDEEGMESDMHFPASVYLDISAHPVILVEAKRGQVLYEKNPDTRLHISIANKIMTALLVAEKVSLDATVTISRESVESEGSRLFLLPGEKYQVEDLLYAIMLKSYNDAANALAEYTGGSIDAFVEMMNKKASELNLKDTFFINPSGLYAEGQYTTARDLATLIRYAITNPSFNKIFSSKTAVWNGPEGPEILFNQNMLFWDYDGVDGGKTGYNDPDKHSAVTAASKSDQKLICVVLDTPEDRVFEDSKNLLRYGYENYRIDKLVSAGEVITAMKLDDNTQLDLISSGDVYYTHPIGDSFISDVSFSLTENPELPISRSQVLGTANFVLKDGTLIKVNLFSSVEIPLPEEPYSFLKKKLTEHRDIFYLLIILAGLEALLIIANIIKLLRWIIRKVFID
jgi:D-alanyl-D-alanine carboxypeptidase (penicillin-binding protein 5/6)